MGRKKNKNSFCVNHELRAAADERYAALTPIENLSPQQQQPTYEDRREEENDAVFNVEEGGEEDDEKSETCALHSMELSNNNNNNSNSDEEDEQDDENIAVLPSQSNTITDAKRRRRKRRRKKQQRIKRKRNKRQKEREEIMIQQQQQQQQLASQKGAAALAQDESAGGSTLLLQLLHLSSDNSHTTTMTRRSMTHDKKRRKRRRLTMESFVTEEGGDGIHENHETVIHGINDKVYSSWIHQVCHVRQGARNRSKLSINLPSFHHDRDRSEESFPLDSIESLEEVEKEQQPSDDDHHQGLYSHECCNSESSTDTTSARAEIESLHTQLCQIKKRLWPAAILCAEACNTINSDVAVNDNKGQYLKAEKTAIDHNNYGEEEDDDDERSDNDDEDHIDPILRDDDITIMAKQEFEETRRACNPFEELGEGRAMGGLNSIFLNRSAMKLANIDAILDFSLVVKRDEVLTWEEEEEEEDTLASLMGQIAKEPPSSSTSSSFLFVDLCGAPGGFSEYIMYRSHLNGIPLCRGYGMSLLGTNEHGHGTPWRLEHMAKLNGGSNCYYRISAGEDGTGDIYNWDNVEALQKDILSDLYGDGAIWEVSSRQVGVGNGRNTGLVDLVVADGGFDAQRNSECQEELSLRMIGCEAAAAMTLLKCGGTFMMKMFGFRTPTTRRILYDLFSSFEKVVLVKPVLSRPASAERYVVFCGFSGPPTGWSGLAWRDKLLLSPKDNVDSANADDSNGGILDGKRHFDNVLDVVDRDILNLNMKACFGILSFLEGRAQCARGENMHDTHGGLAKKQSVDIHLYKKAWKISC